MNKSISEGDLRAIEVNAERVAAGAPASAKHWGKTALRLVGAVREAREWVGRLTASTRVLTCAFCGDAYPPGTPETNHERLTEHVMVCPRHPIRQVQEALNRALDDSATLRDRADAALARAEGAEKRLAMAMRYHIANGVDLVPCGVGEWRFVSETPRGAEWIYGRELMGNYESATAAFTALDRAAATKPGNA